MATKQKEFAAAGTTWFHTGDRKTYKANGKGVFTVSTPGAAFMQIMEGPPGNVGELVPGMTVMDYGKLLDMAKGLHRDGLLSMNEEDRNSPDVWLRIRLAAAGVKHHYSEEGGQGVFVKAVDGPYTAFEGMLNVLHLLAQGTPKQDESLPPFTEQMDKINKCIGLADWLSQQDDDYRAYLKELSPQELEAEWQMMTAPRLDASLPSSVPTDTAPNVEPQNAAPAAPATVDSSTPSEPIVDATKPESSAPDAVESTCSTPESKEPSPSTTGEDTANAQSPAPASTAEPCSPIITDDTKRLPAIASVTIVEPTAIEPPVSPEKMDEIIAEGVVLSAGPFVVDNDDKANWVVSRVRTAQNRIADRAKQFFLDIKDDVLWLIGYEFWLKPQLERYTIAEKLPRKNGEITKKSHRYKDGTLFFRKTGGWKCTSRFKVQEFVDKLDPADLAAYGVKPRRDYSLKRLYELAEQGVPIDGIEKEPEHPFGKSGIGIGKSAWSLASALKAVAREIKELAKKHDDGDDDDESDE